MMMFGEENKMRDSISPHDEGTGLPFKLIQNLTKHMQYSTHGLDQYIQVHGLK